MTIKRISKINHRIFQNFLWPASLPDFERYNLIYGWNGSGKTTLSNLFRALEKKTNIADGDVEFELENGNRIIGSDLAENERIPQIKVFNRDFVAESVFPIKRGNIEPIFVLGEDSVEKQKQIDILIAEKTEITRKLSAKTAEFETAKRDEEKFAIEQGRHIKHADGLAGTIGYSNYNQAIFRAKAEELITRGNVDELVLAEEKLDEFRKISRAEKKAAINLLSFTSPDGDRWAMVTGELLRTSIVTNFLEEFTGAPTREHWVRQGLEIHGMDATHCKFCGNPLPSGRIQQLEAHFNDNYKKFIAELNAAKQAIEIEIQSLNISMPDFGNFYDDLQNDYKQQVNIMNEQKEAMRGRLQALIRLLDIKLSAPFQLVSVDVAPAALSLVAVDTVNAIIKRHNDRTEEFNNQVDNARKQMEAHFVAQAVDEYIEQKNAKNNLEAECMELQDTIKSLVGQIRGLERDIIEHQKPAEELSADLAIYLGHGELEIRPVEDAPGYLVYRSGKPAQNLSEGEKTGIAFLYFLKSLAGKEFNLADGVVVIDDPVSSLDANSLYGAFAFLKEKTVDAKQLFILTHHFTLFKQAKSWLKRMPKKDPLKKVAKYQIQCECGESYRISKICRLDKLLDEYDSEYYYLFDQVYKIGNISAQEAHLDQYYGVPNLARRLLEAFFAFKRPHLLKGDQNSSLYEVINQTELSVAEKTKIDRFLNIYSHLQHVGDQEHDISILSETPTIMRSVLKMIKTEDPTHFAEMKQVIGAID